MELIHRILGPDLQAAFFIIANLVLIESLLSVDNAAVLATMVMDLPKDERDKALKYGIIGAYVFRGLSLLFASYLVNIWWLKPIGGIYLIYLAASHFIKKAKHQPAADEVVVKSRSRVYNAVYGTLGPFWATVALVEVMDMAFSIDNVFAAVAFTDNIYLIWIGVFIGILAMRLVAQAFVRLMHAFPFLEAVAFAVIGLLGLKLTVSIYVHLAPDAPIAQMMESERADMYVSILTVTLFALPLLTSWLFNVPQRGQSAKAD